MNASVYVLVSNKLKFRKFLYFGKKDIFRYTTLAFHDKENLFKINLHWFIFNRPWDKL